MNFSIIVPVFNKQKYILDTLHSALSQKFTDFEVIVVDDGSTDESISLVKSIKDERIKLIQQKNSGVAVARNTGMKHATGEWVGFLDADDWQHPEFLQNIYDMIQKFPEINVFATRFVPMLDGDNWKPEPWFVPSPSYEKIVNLPKRWTQGIPFFTGSIVIRHRVLNELDTWFEPGESNGEDLDLWFRLAEKNSIILMKQPLIAYRTAVANSLSSENNSNTLPPYVTRMAARAKSLPHALKNSTQNFVLFSYVSMAKKAAIKGNKLQSIALLGRVAKSGLFDRRWWITLLMLLILPRKLICKWETWRKTRKYASIKS